MLPRWAILLCDFCIVGEKSFDVNGKFNPEGTLYRERSSQLYLITRRYDKAMRWCNFVSALHPGSICLWGSCVFERVMPLFWSSTKKFSRRARENTSAFVFRSALAVLWGTRLLAQRSGSMFLKTSSLIVGARLNMRMRSWSANAGVQEMDHLDVARDV